MSATIPVGVVPVAIQEPVTAVQKPVRYGVLEGPSVVSWQQYPASSVSNGNIQISANQPDRKTLIDRRVLLQVDANFSFTGQVPGGAVPLLDIGVSDAFRAYPLTAVTDSQTMKIGGKAVTVGSANDMWPNLFRYHNMRDQRDLDNSTTPAMLDQFQAYSQGLATNRNPLANYGDNPFEMPRGGWTASQLTNLVNPAPAGAGLSTSTFTCTVTEPLFLSPFLFARDDLEPALYGVDTFNFTSTYSALSRMWSRFNVAGGSTIDPTNAAHNITVTFTGARLLFRQLTPNPTMQIPRVLSYSYFNPVLYVQQASGSVLAGAQTTIVSSNISLPGVPRRLYIWASERQQDKTFLSSDTMFRIDSVTVKWGTRTFLREASPVDLYKIAVKNGCNLSWPQWTSFCGGILCLDMGSDIGLAATEAAGSEGKFQVSVTLTCTNVGPSTIFPAVKICGVQEGVVQIVDGSVYINENPVNAIDVINAQPAAGFSYKRSQSIYGGDFFSDFVSGFKKGAQIAANIGEKVLPVASLVAPELAAVQKFGIPALRAIGGVKRLKSRKALRRRMRGRGFEDEKDEKEEVLEDEYEDEGDSGEDEVDPRDLRYGRDDTGAEFEQSGEDEESDDPVSAYLASRSKR